VALIAVAAVGALLVVRARDSDGGSTAPTPVVAASQTTAPSAIPIPSPTTPPPIDVAQLSQQGAAKAVDDSVGEA